ITTNETALALIAFALTIYDGVTVGSNAPFYSGKKFAMGRSVPFWMMLLLVLVFVFVSSDPPIVLFGLFVIYGLSVWVLMFWRWQRARTLRQRRRERNQARQQGMDDTDA